MDTGIWAKNTQAVYKTICSTRTKRLLKRWLLTLLRGLFLAGFCFLIIYPVIIMISKAFMSKADIFDNEVLLIPKHFSLETVKLAASAEMLDYGKSLFHSLMISFLSALLQTVSCMLAGYGFARFNFRFRNILFGCVIFTMIVPPQLAIIPIYMQFYNLHMINTYFPFILLSITAVALKNGLFIFLFRQFFKNMPKETEESALVDGAGTFRIFAQVMVPNAMTIIATVFLFAFVWQYNDTTYTGTFLQQGGEIQVLPLKYNALATISADKMLESNYDPMLASPQYMAVIKSTGVLLILAPILVLYAFTQRFFVEGIERSGLVG